jgi:uncharacterized phage protein (TIGR01671 family)
MNRAKKCRVWCKASGHFTDNCHAACSGLQLLWLHTGNQITISNLDDEEYFVQYYTGRKDKTGKEICEGDIVKYKEYIVSEVVYSDCTTGFVLDSSRRHNIDRKYGDYIPMSRDLEYCYLIVGNIFENPELLK